MSEKEYQRHFVSSTSHDERFIISSNSYSQQYCNIYSKRALLMRPMIQLMITKYWGSDIPVLQKIIQAENEFSISECVLIGAVIKNLPLRISVLDDFRDHFGISSTISPVENFTSETDSLQLEDESGRIWLVGPFMNRLTPLLPTGVVLGVKGRLLKAGEFEVFDVVFAGGPSSSLLPPPGDSPVGVKGEIEVEEGKEEGDLLLMMSGLELGGREDDANTLQSLELLSDFLAGRGGGSEDLSLSRRIVRVFLAGNSIKGSSGSAVDSNEKGREKASKHSHPWSHGGGEGPLNQFDIFLSSLLATVPVTLLPGPSDPSNLTLPQQPFYSCLFPQSSRFSSLSLASNPHCSSLLDRTILGTSGQPSLSVASQTCKASPSPSPDCPVSGDEEKDESQWWLHTLRRSLLFAHLCPTAPDSLPCFPFTSTDPFVIPSPPDVLFAGNQPAFSSVLCSVPQSDSADKQCLVVTLPYFRLTGQVVLVNLRTLHAFPLSFSVTPSSSPIPITIPPPNWTEFRTRKGDLEETEIDFSESNEPADL